MVLHFDLNESKGVCNFSVLVIRARDMESADDGGAQLTKGRYISTERSAPDTRAVTFSKNISRFSREQLSRVCMCATIELALTCAPNV